MRTKLYKIIVLIIISTLLNKIIVSCKEKNSELKMIRGKQIEISADLDKDKDFIEEIEPYRKEMQNRIKEVLCFNPRNLSRNETELESSLGNFYADACFKAGDSLFFIQTGNHIDFALFNYGGIRTEIPQGNVTVEHIFKLMPFENKLVAVKLSGERVAELLSYLENRKQAHPVSGLKLTLKQNQLSTIQIGNKDFGKNMEYLVLTHDYLQHGGDNMEFFKDPIELYPLEYKVRDAIIDHLKSIDTLSPSLDGRFTKIN